MRPLVKLVTPTPSYPFWRRIAASRISCSTIRPSRVTSSDLNYQWSSQVSALGSCRAQIITVHHNIISRAITKSLFFLACGYNLTDQRIEQLNNFLDEKSAQKVDLPLLLMTLTYLKELELQNEQENDADEYLDAFVALGGQPDKDGYVSKENLIQIIKAEFELTIDMEEFLRKIGGNSEEINYYQFCVLLDAGTGGNPSRVSSYLS